MKGVDNVLGLIEADSLDVKTAEKVRGVNEQQKKSGSTEKDSHRKEVSMASSMVPILTT
tara:strand:- start:136 stop:312 length:177 start_codon:yes stop_codon:yes gene_type:complete